MTEEEKKIIKKVKEKANNVKECFLIGSFFKLLQ